MADKLSIGKNIVVTLHYTLKKDSADGRLIEETIGSTPLSFIFGIGQMIPGFESNLLGKYEGDKYSFLLAPGEAYGDLNIDAIVEVPIANFKNSEGIIDSDAIKAGAPIRMKNQDGKSFQGLVIESSDTSVKVDFNHPMAGQNLHFSGEVIAIRSATKEELDHGHVHDGMAH